MPDDGSGTPITPGKGGGVPSLAGGQKVGGGRYELVRQLGQGGMGVVWLAHDSRLDEDVALKFLPQAIRGDVSALDELRQETLKSRKLTHPNIIRIHDLDESPDEQPFLSMEYVDGPSLAQLKAEQPQRLFTWEYLKPIVQQLCEALDYAHSEKVVHRDLKPANMMLDARGRLKLADFGIAAAASDSLSRVTRGRNTSGTPAYMSPQQMEGKPPKVTDDIYALGATLYELLTSKPPFYHGDILTQVKEVPPTPPEQRLAELNAANDIPQDVAAMVMACLAKDPALRPQSARAVADWIGLTLGSVAAVPARRSGKTAVLAVIAIVAMALITGMLLMRPPEGAPVPPEPGAPDRIEEGWFQVFEPGRTDYMSNKDKWRWHDNVLAGTGNKPGAMVRTDVHTNIQVKAEVRFRRGASGSILLRAKRAKKGPPPYVGYVVKIGDTAKDFRRTGTVYGVEDVVEPPVKPEEWFTMHIILVSQRVMVRLNGQTVVDAVATDKRFFDEGIIALLHSDNSGILLRNIRAQLLPENEAEAWKLVRKAAPGLE